MHIFPFKIHLANMGLLRHLVKPEPTAFGEDNRLFIKFKDAFIVNLVLQTRVTQFEVVLRYWMQKN